MLKSIDPITLTRPAIASNTVWLGVDPGKTGCFAVCYVDCFGKHTTSIYKMPKTPAALRDFIVDLQKKYDPKTNRYHCFCELVGFYRPGCSATSAVTFGKGVGGLTQLLTDFYIPCTWLTPQKWMKAFGCPNDLEKTARKNWIAAKVRELYPKMKITQQLSDGLGILHTGLHIL